MRKVSFLLLSTATSVTFAGCLGVAASDESLLSDDVIIDYSAVSMSGASSLTSSNSCISDPIFGNIACLSENASVSFSYSLEKAGDTACLFQVTDIANQPKLEVRPQQIACDAADAPGRTCYSCGTFVSSLLLSGYSDFSRGHRVSAALYADLPAFDRYTHAFVRMVRVLLYVTTTWVGGGSIPPRP